MSFFSSVKASVLRYYGYFVFIVRREWEFLLVHKKKFLLFNTLLPIASFIIMTAIFHEPTLREIPIAVVDNDGSNMSHNLILSLDASPYLKVTKSLPNAEDGKSLLSNAEIYGMVVIPKSFSKTVLGYKGANVALYYNNQFIILGGLVNKGVVSVVQDFSNKYNITFAESEGTPIYAAEVSAAPLVFNDEVLFNPYMNYRYFMLLGLVPAMFQLFAIGALVYAFGYDFKTKKASEIADIVKVAPLTSIIAKSFPYFIIYTGLGALMLFLIFWYIGTPLETGGFIILVSSLLYTLVSIVGGIFIICLSMGNLRMALSVTAVYAAPAFAYAGITFPYIGMPFFARAWCYFLPVSHYHEILVNEAIRGAEYSNTPANISYLFIFFVIGLFISVILYRFIMSRPKLWGKL